MRLLIAGFLVRVQVREPRVLLGVDAFIFGLGLVFVLFTFLLASSK